MKLDEVPEVTDDQLDEMIARAKAKIHAREAKAVELTREITLKAIKDKKEHDGPR